MTESAVIDGHEIMEVGGHRVNGPSRGQLLARGAVMAERNPLDDLLESPLGRVRVARKPWRCRCAHPIRWWTAKRICEHGWSMGRFTSEAAAREHMAERSGKNCHGGKPPTEERWELDSEPNPNYRTDCLGDIPVGTRYFEYLGEALTWESGYRYCASCAVVWVGKQ